MCIWNVVTGETYPNDDDIIADSQGSFYNVIVCFTLKVICRY